MFTLIKDSIFNEQSATKMGEMEVRYQTAEKDKEITGDNLTGGFVEKANGSGDNHAPHIMEDVVEESDAIEEEIVEEEDTIEEKIQVGKGRNVTNNKTEIVGAGGKANNVKAPNVTVAETAKKYNALLAEAKKLKAENEMFRTSLKGFRKMLGETAVFNSNLTYVTKLFLEHSTTGSEKKQILDRFDNEVSTLEESKKLYKNIVSELGSKTPISESVENKFVSSKSTSQSAQLNETKLYVDPAQARILDLMKRTNK